MGIDMGVQRIEFHGITLKDKQWMDEKFAQDDRNACEFSFANNFIWRKTYEVKVAEVCGCLVIRSTEDGGFRYSFPVGTGDKRAAVERLRALCKAEGYPLFLSPMLEEDRQLLLAWFPGAFLVSEQRENFDYIYSREKLATLAGKKLHGKRNHIARFCDEVDWRYAPITAENAEDCRQMTYTWIRMRAEKWNEEMREEIEVLHEAFDNREALGLIGGALYREDEIVAFTMGEPLNSDTFIVHFEKAYPSLQGAYPMINQQFVQHECGDFAYINREDDVGDEGLRRAKMSYYPEILLEKYCAVESAVVYADRARDAGQIRELWMACFADSAGEVGYYMERRMTDQNMLVIHADGKIVSMASFLPVQYRLGGEYVDAYYVYAVGTLPEYRGRGYASQILEFAKTRYNAPLVLAPADGTLEGYYEKRGFRLFSLARPEMNAGGAMLRAQELQVSGGAAEMEAVSPEEYVKIRDEKLGTEGYVRWDAEAVGYAMSANEKEGGRAIAIAAGQPGGGGDSRDVIMYRPQGESLHILETTLLPEQLGRILPELLAATGRARAVMETLAGMCWLPEHLQGQGSSTGYLGLTLD